MDNLQLKIGDKVINKYGLIPGTIYKIIVITKEGYLCESIHCPNSSAMMPGFRFTFSKGILEHATEEQIKNCSE